MWGRNNIWGGALEIHPAEPNHELDEEHSHNNSAFDRSAYHAPSDEVKQSWLLRPDNNNNNKTNNHKKRKTRHIKNIIVTSIVGVTIFLVLLIFIIKFKPHHRHQPLPAYDNYTQALHKAILFFNAQQSGRLPHNNNVSWRGDSCLKDEQVGGYFDAGDATKYNFPAAFAMTMLSWSVVEYSQKYEDVDLLNNVKDVIKWGTDYLLKTFKSSSNSTDTLASYIGEPAIGPTKGTKNYKCWMRPEEYDNQRPAIQCSTCPALAAETAAALAAASIVFKDNLEYSKELIHGATILFNFATQGKGDKYSGGADPFLPFYNSNGYWDEFLWVGTWMYFATGNSSYLDLITSLGLEEKVNSMGQSSNLDKDVFSWDNKLPGAILLLTRVRMFLNYGYPYEEVLKKFHNQVDNMMCSYLPNFKRFRRTKAGLIMLNHGNPSPLQYVVNAAFLAKLYSDYMNNTFVHGILCGDKFFNVDALSDFAKTQINYILGNNPQRMSYIVGFGNNYPQHVHHMGASIPIPRNKGQKYGCGGWHWRDTKEPNPNIIVGAMVAGPDKFDGFRDVRFNYNYTEPTLAGNSGLVAALVALSETKNTRIDKNTIFYSVRAFPLVPPPPLESP